KPIVQYDNF
nr:Chain C, PEPTIDE LS6 (KPIVQYDNF) [Human immunodeficiency virus 1]